jgi:hypothetical protein
MVTTKAIRMMRRRKTFCGDGGHACVSNGFDLNGIVAKIAENAANSVLTGRAPRFRRPESSCGAGVHNELLQRSNLDRHYG